MTEHSPKDPVSLEDLKRAINAVGTRPFTDGDFFTTSRLCSWESRRADAWRAAFEWLHEDVDRCCNPSEYEEGVALIRSKLT